MPLYIDNAITMSKINEKKYLLKSKFFKSILNITDKNKLLKIELLKNKKLVELVSVEDMEKMNH